MVYYTFSRRFLCFPVSDIGVQDSLMSWGICINAEVSLSDWMSFFYSCNACELCDLVECKELLVNERH